MLIALGPFVMTLGDLRQTQEIHVCVCVCDFSDMKSSMNASLFREPYIQPFFFTIVIIISIIIVVCTI